MKERILLNERYGAIEIDSNGIITGHNMACSEILSSSLPAAGESLKGRPLSEIVPAGEMFGGQTQRAAVEKQLSSISGIDIIDSIEYSGHNSLVVRFAAKNKIYTPFFNALKSSSFIYIELDENMNILFASDPLVAKIQIDKSLLYGHPLSEFLDPNDEARFSESAGSVGTGSRLRVVLEELKFYFSDSPVTYSMEINPVYVTDEENCGYICRLFDGHAGERYMAVDRRTRGMTALANFAGGIAHDYNNALTAILGNITLARMETKKGSETEELLRDAELAGIRIKKLTERLGLYTRGVKPFKEISDIGSIVKNTASEVFAAYSGRYDVKIQDRLHQAEVDRELVRLMFKEIMMNALESADNADGEIVIEVQLTEVQSGEVYREISLVQGKYILILISDNGSGIGDQFTGDIFDPYVTSREGRDGIGLALAYTIIKRHRGFISYDMVEAGTVFKIYLPLF